jgi:Ca2+/Na+ antiporter
MSVSIKKTMTTQPMLFGTFIGLALLIGIFLMVIWAPWIGEDLGRHKRLAQAVVFTAANFAIFISTLWVQRRNPAFWPTILVLFLLHVFGIFIYSNYVQPILVWQWPILGIIEYYTAAFFLYWTHGQHRSDKREKANVDAKEPS